MARPTLATHPKFHRLAAAVGGTVVARGILEVLWDTAYASGDPVIGEAEEVEAIGQWKGEPGALARALVAGGRGFLDLTTDASGRDLYVVHDLEDHAPDYVLKRWQKESDRQAKGKTIRSVRQEAARKMWDAKRALQSNGNANGALLHANDSHLQATVAPPAPAPAPAPKNSLPPAIAGAPDHVPRGTLEPERRPFTGVSLATMFGAVRAEVLGGFGWEGTRCNVHDAATRAAEIEANNAGSEVRHTMEIWWGRVKSGDVEDPKKCIEDDAWAFGCWWGKFRGIRDQVLGVAPVVPNARAQGPPKPSGPKYAVLNRETTR